MLLTTCLDAEESGWQSAVKVRQNEVRSQVQEKCVPTSLRRSVNTKLVRHSQRKKRSCSRKKNL